MLELLMVESDLQAYMSNRLNEEEVVHLFQTILDNGLLVHLPELFHKRAAAMARAGFVTLPC